MVWCLFQMMSEPEVGGITWQRNRSSMQLTSGCMIVDAESKCLSHKRAAERKLERNKQNFGSKDSPAVFMRKSRDKLPPWRRQHCPARLMYEDASVDAREIRGRREPILHRINCRRLRPLQRFVPISIEQYSYAFSRISCTLCMVNSLADFSFFAFTLTMA